MARNTKQIVSDVNVEVETPAIFEATVREVALPSTPRGQVNNSAGVAKSWEDPTIRAARQRRLVPVVDGVVFRSVPAAFNHFYPQASISEHQKFRALLRDKGTVSAHGRTWVLQSL